MDQFALIPFTYSAEFNDKAKHQLLQTINIAHSDGDYVTQTIGRLPNKRFMEIKLTRNDGALGVVRETRITQREYFNPKFYYAKGQLCKILGIFPTGDRLVQFYYASKLEPKMAFAVISRTDLRKADADYNFGYCNTDIYTALKEFGYTTNEFHKLTKLLREKGLARCTPMIRETEYHRYVEINFVGPAKRLGYKDVDKLNSVWSTLTGGFVQVIRNRLVLSKMVELNVAV